MINSCYCYTIIVAINSPIISLVVTILNYYYE